MFHGCGAVDVSTSTDFANWTRINSTERFGRPHWLVGGPPSDPTRGPWAEPGPSPQRLSDGNLLFVVIEAGQPAGSPKLCPYHPNQEAAYWGAGWAILDGDDPTVIIQRGTRLLFPRTPWEVNGTTDGHHQWEMHGCMIGATTGIRPIPGEQDAFMVFYGAGDSVSGAAKIQVRAL